MSLGKQIAVFYQNKEMDQSNTIKAEKQENGAINRLFPIKYCFGISIFFQDL